MDVGFESSVSNYLSQQQWGANGRFAWWPVPLWQSHTSTCPAGSLLHSCPEAKIWVHLHMPWQCLSPVSETLTNIPYFSQIFSFSFFFSPSPIDLPGTKNKCSVMSKLRLVWVRVPGKFLYGTSRGHKADHFLLQCRSKLASQWPLKRKIEVQNIKKYKQNVFIKKNHLHQKIQNALMVIPHF